MPTTARERAQKKLDSAVAKQSVAKQKYDDATAEVEWAQRHPALRDVAPQDATMPEATVARQDIQSDESLGVQQGDDASDPAGGEADGDASDPDGAAAPPELVDEAEAAAAALMAQSDEPAQVKDPFEQF